MAKVKLYRAALTFLGTLLLSQRAYAQSEQLVTIGDSYTIGEGVTEEERWPNRLVAALAQKGIAIALAENPARTGWTTDDALHQELPQLAQSNATVVTVLVGVNDQVQGASAEEFARSLTKLLDAIQASLAARDCNAKRLLLITIPDYSLTPNGRSFTASQNATETLTAFNRVIKEQAAERGLAFADIAPLANEVLTAPHLVASDGLHPSGEQYRRWLTAIEPAMTALLKTPSCHPPGKPLK